MRVLDERLRAMLHQLGHVYAGTTFGDTERPLRLAFRPECPDCQRLATIDSVPASPGAPRLETPSACRSGRTPGLAATSEPE